MNVLRVGRYDVDLDEVYRRMYAEARTTADGRLIHDRGLKYLLGEMLGLTADAGVPDEPLFSLRICFPRIGTLSTPPPGGQH